MSIEVGKKYKARNGSEWIIIEESSRKNVYIGLNTNGNGKKNLFSLDGDDYWGDYTYKLEIDSREQTVELKVKVEVDTTEAIDAIITMQTVVLRLAETLKEVNSQLSEIHAKLGVQD